MWRRTTIRNKKKQNDHKKQSTTTPTAQKKLHPDDLELLEWKGSLGDTAADQRQVRQEQARAAARQWLQQQQGAVVEGGGLPSQRPLRNSSSSAAAASSNRNKKAFSRVLREDMQTWMKKTTYLSNDYSRKVHDFKSLAQTKQELAVDLAAKQEEMAQRRSVRAVEASFAANNNNNTRPLQHPTHPHLQPVGVWPVLPHVANWGRAFTHVVMDKPPMLPTTTTTTTTTNGPSSSSSVKEAVGAGAFCANVALRDGRMSCDLMAPSAEKKKNNDNKEKLMMTPIQTFDLDVVPLKEEDAPHVNFCLWVGEEQALYLPIASRIQLATGRPVRGHEKKSSVGLERRPLTATEERELEERMAAVDRDLAEKHGIRVEATTTSNEEEPAAEEPGKDDDDDGEGDFGDDNDDSSSDDEQVFGGGTKTIVAED